MCNRKPWLSSRHTGKLRETASRSTQPNSQNVRYANIIFQYSSNQIVIYDYYGFPAHYYKVKYPNTGSKEVSSKVLSALKTSGISAKGVSRGLDHGVFAPFTVAFNPESNPLNVPLVQVSLFDSDDADQHYRLGEAMQGLREEGIVVIVSGMAVHNLRDMWQAMQRPAPMPYSLSFDAALKEAVEQKVCVSAFPQNSMMMKA
jgi:4,5-DOPA dioxygenase extradiol